MMRILTPQYDTFSFLFCVGGGSFFRASGASDLPQAERSEGIGFAKRKINKKKGTTTTTTTIIFLYPPISLANMKKVKIFP